MTSKKELKKLLEILRDEVRDLKTEIEVMKTLIVDSNKNTVYQLVGTSEPNRFSWTPYTPPDSHTITISDSDTRITNHKFYSYPDGSVQSEV